MFNNIEPTDLNAWQLNDTRDGLIYKPTEELKKAYEELFTSIFPELNLDTSTPQGQLIEDLVYKDTQTLNLINEIVNSFFNGGNGRWLDNTNYLNYRLTRKKNIPSSAIVTIEGKPRTTIQKGFIVSDGSEEFIYNSGEAVVGLNGYVDIEMIGGNTQVKANTLTNILTPLQGIYRATNKNQSTEPVALESDSDFYQRALKYGAISNSATLNSMISYVYGIDGVEKVSGYENPGSQPLTYRGTTFEPHSFGLVVKGGYDNDIGLAIQDKKAPGPAMMGDTLVVVPDPFESTILYTYKFFRPSINQISFKVNVKLYNNTPSNYKEVICNALINYISKKPIGATITQGECICEVLKHTNNNFEITDLQLSKAPSTTMGYTPLELDFIEEAFTNSDSINIISELSDKNKNGVYSKNLKDSDKAVNEVE